MTSIAKATSFLAMLIPSAEVLAQVGSSEPVQFCPILQRIAGLAAGQHRFQSITGKPREGEYSDATLSLPGWRGCSLYGLRTYTCDSSALPTAQKARDHQRQVLNEISACLGGDWAEDRNRSTSVYVILHQRSGRASITLSTDLIEHDQHVVRFILFLR